MSDRKALSQALFAELPALIDAAHRGDIRGDQMKRLEQLLRDPEARELYLELVWESDVLATWAKESEQERLAAVRRPPRATVLGFLHSSLRRAGWALARHPVAAASLALVAAVPLIAWLASTPSPPQVATDEGGNRPPRRDRKSTGHGVHRVRRRGERRRRPRTFAASTAATPRC